MSHTFSFRQRPLLGRSLRLGLVLGVLGLAFFVGVVPLVGAYVVRHVVLPRVERRLGLRLQVESVQVRLTRVRLFDLRVLTEDKTAQELCRAPQVEASYAPLSLLLGRVQLDEVRVDRPQVQVVRGEGDDPIKGLLSRLREGRGKAAAADSGGGGGSLRGPRRIRVTGATLDLRDVWGSAHVNSADLDVEPGQEARAVLSEISADLGAVSARAERVTVAVLLLPGRLSPQGLPSIGIEEGAVSPWKGLALTGINGKIEPDPQHQEREVISLRGGYGGVRRALWDAGGWVRAGDRERGSEAELRLRAARFQLSSLDPILKDTPIIDSARAQVDASLDLRYAAHALDFNGSFHLSGLSIFTPRLSAEPVRDFGLAVDARGRIDPRARRYRLDSARFRWRGAEATLEAEAEGQPAHLRVINVPQPMLDQTPAGPGWRERWRTVSLHLTVPQIPCQSVLESIPPEIVPHLQGFRLGGTFFTDIRLNVDFANLLRLPPPPPEDDPEGEAGDPERAGGASRATSAAAVLPAAGGPTALSAVAPGLSAGTVAAPAEPGRKRRHRSRRGALPPLRLRAGEGVSLQDKDAPKAVPEARRRGDHGSKERPGPGPVALLGKVGIDGCKVLAAPAEMNIERLFGSFEHTVEVEPEHLLHFLIGPENPDFVPYEEISPYLVNSIMTTEDNGFMRHRGFIGPEFRSALEQNLQRGYFRLGASSITMQMVKNVMLSREKTLSRKLQELFLTWYLEQNLTKERILEIYFNAIEFGPYLYGIGKAVRHYFGKTPKELTPREAAWFSSILPNPKRRYVHFCKGKPDLKWEAYLTRILRRVHERGRLTDEEFAASLEERFEFNREEAAPERECLALIKRMTEPALVPGATPAGATPAGATPAGAIPTLAPAGR